MHTLGSIHEVSNLEGRQIKPQELPLPNETSHLNPSNLTGRSATGLSRDLYAILIVASLGSSFQFGYGTGVMNNCEKIIRNQFIAEGKSYTIGQWGITVSSFGIGGLIGSIIGPKLFGACMGRRATLISANFFVFLSSYLIAFASSWWMMALGRVSTGVVAGIATAVVPTYFSEISPVALRGSVSTVHQLGITVGILVSQILSTPSLKLLGSAERWQWLFLVPCVASVIELLILPFCPESPCYLFATSGEIACRKSLNRLIDSSMVDIYVDNIKEEIQQHNDPLSKSLSIWRLLHSKELHKQLIVGIFVQLMMQFSGIDAVFYYSTSVFIKARVKDPEFATTSLGFLNVLVTIWAVKYMDITGRRPLLLWSWTGMFISYIAITFSFIMDASLPCMDILAILALIGVIINFAYGPGCVAWFIIAEIFPLYARDSAMAIGIFINWIANWLVAATFPLLLEALSPKWTFIIFIFTTGFFFHFTYKYVPETKGRTIAEISRMFKNNAVGIPKF